MEFGWRNFVATHDSSQASPTSMGMPNRRMKKAEQAEWKSGLYSLAMWFLERASERNAIMARGKYLKADHERRYLDFLRDTNNHPDPRD